MIRTGLIVVLILESLLFCACSDDTVSVDGNGLTDIMVVEIPEGYEPEGNDVLDDDGEVISRSYRNDTSSVFFMILSYRGKAVMGSDGTIEDWFKEQDDIADTVSLEDADSEVYICPDPETSDRRIIEGVFGYRDYVIMAGMESHDGEPPLTDEQIDEFYRMLESIELK